MHDSRMQVIKRAFNDTFSGLARPAITGLIGFIGFFWLYGNVYGWEKAMDEAQVWLFGVGGAIAAVAITFLFYFALAPYRIQKDRAAKVEKRNAELESGTALPNTVLKSLADKQTECNQLNERLVTLARLFEQYRRLLNSTFLNAKFRGVDLADDDVGIVATFIANEAKKFLPGLPFQPDQPLVFQTGWNQYRYIFSGPMRVPPKVGFPELPDNISAELKSVSKIDFEVQFFHIDSQNRKKIEPQYPVEASAEL